LDQQTLKLRREKRLRALSPAIAANHRKSRVFGQGTLSAWIVSDLEGYRSPVDVTDIAICHA
jgi:hypothetical protein